MADFTRRLFRPIGKEVHRLGLALNYGLEPKNLAAALERGVNYVFWSTRASRGLRAEMRSALARDRERIVLATGPTLGFFGGSVRRACEAELKRLGTDYIDVLQLFWLGKMSAWTDATVAELVKLREEGKARAIGISIHDRPRAGKLAVESPLDVFMLRYNAAHPGCEADVFPHLGARQPSVVAYTATSWRRLLERPRGWAGPVMTPGDCYRFCLSSPHVDVVLCGAGSLSELDDNLTALNRGAITPEEERWMRDFGRVVHG
jgi:aryl-alcohol dehydrogenase-like predicted oxidoreductase